VRLTPLPAGSKAGLPSFYRPRLCAAHAVDADGLPVVAPPPALGEALETSADGDHGERSALLAADAPLRLFVAYRLGGEARRLDLADEAPLELGSRVVEG
jgi:hypothetical protein